MADLNGLFQELQGLQVVAAHRICAGKNSKVYRVSCNDGKMYAVKFYIHPTADGRNRLEQEWKALNFMEGAGVTCVPVPVVRSIDKQAAVFSFLDGEKINHHSLKDISEILVFMGRLKSGCNQAAEYGIDLAAESCLSLADIIKNLDYRRRILLKLPCHNNAFKEMHHFLNADFMAAIDASIRFARERLNQFGIREDDILPAQYRCLSPSDFGFHNALRGADGSLQFLDFEYFGWDDPVKAVSDFLLHPGMELNNQEKTFFYKGFVDLFAEDTLFEVRFESLMPLFRLKWCLILLNEFLREGMSRRRFAGGVSETDDHLRQVQLRKAKLYLNKDKELLDVVGFGE